MRNIDTPPNRLPRSTEASLAVRRIPRLPGDPSEIVRRLRKLYTAIERDSPTRSIELTQTYVTITILLIQATSRVLHLLDVLDAINLCNLSVHWSARLSSCPRSIDIKERDLRTRTTVFSRRPTYLFPFLVSHRSFASALSRSNSCRRSVGYISAGHLQQRHTVHEASRPSLTLQLPPESLAAVVSVVDRLGSSTTVATRDLDRQDRQDRQDRHD